MTPSRVEWDPAHAVGHAQLDAQHRELIAACNRLADDCPDGGGADAGFEQAFARVKARVLAHLEAEAMVLAELGDPRAEDPRLDAEEFSYLADEIITTGHFDPVELQRFVALWCVGHVVESARRLRALLGGDGATGR